MVGITIITSPGETPNQTATRILRESSPNDHPMDVTDWYVTNKPDDALLYKHGVAQQVMFMRDTIGCLLAPKIDHTVDERRSLVKVCSTHRSKSVVLPVFEINWKRGVRFTMRNNFHDWGMSVESHKPIVWDFNGLCSSQKVESYCEGFPHDRRFTPHYDNPLKFSVSFLYDHQLYTFIYLLMRQFPVAE